MLPAESVKLQYKMHSNACIFLYFYSFWDITKLLKLTKTHMCEWIVLCAEIILEVIWQQKVSNSGYQQLPLWLYQILALAKIQPFCKSSHNPASAIILARFRILARLTNYHWIVLILVSFEIAYSLMPNHWVCKPAYLVPVPSQDKLGGLYQEGHPA